MFNKLKIKLVTGLLVVALVLGISVHSASAAAGELAQFVEILISLNLIPAEKIELARSVANIIDKGQHPDQINTSDPFCGSFTRNLTVGSTGTDVTLLQQALTQDGYLQMPKGSNFGYFGSLTQQALAKWQSDNGLAPAKGYFDTATIITFSKKCTISTQEEADGITVDLIDVDTIKRPSDEVGINERMEVTFTLDITSYDDDIYIPSTVQDWGYLVSTGGAGLLSYVVDVDSDAERVGNYFEIKEGYSERFDIVLTGEAVQTGAYYLALDYTHYRTGSVNGPTDVLNFDSTKFKSRAQTLFSRTAEVATTTVDVAFVSATFDHSATSSPETAQYRIRFDVTVGGNDIYIPAKIDGHGGIEYFIKDNKGAIAYFESVTENRSVSSSADDVGLYWRIREGETESFNISVVAEALKPGYYKLDIDSLWYYVGSPNSNSVKHVVRLNKDFESNLLFLAPGNAHEDLQVSVTGDGVISDSGYELFYLDSNNILNDQYIRWEFDADCPAGANVISIVVGSFCDTPYVFFRKEPINNHKIWAYNYTNEYKTVYLTVNAYESDASYGKKGNFIDSYKTKLVLLPNPAYAIADGSVEVDVNGGTSFVLSSGETKNNIIDFDVNAINDDFSVKTVYVELINKSSNVNPKEFIDNISLTASYSSPVNGELTIAKENSAVYAFGKNAVNGLGHTVSDGRDLKYNVQISTVDPRGYPDITDDIDVEIAVIEVNAVKVSDKSDATVDFVNNDKSVITFKSYGANR